MSNSDFNQLSQFIYNQVGIKMPPIKRTLLESRLQKRLTTLNIPNFKEYCNYLFSPEGMKNELIQMVDVVTTNKTDFFREANHFEFLKDSYLPEFTRNTRKQIKVWSAGCSSGEEVYTLGMVLNEFSEESSYLDFSILGTDISSNVLSKAVTAIYAEDRTIDIPIFLKRKYFLKSKDPIKKCYRVIPELRKKTYFERLNFMDDVYNISTTFDVIFCRNVLIYFDKQTQERVINKLCSKLNKGGMFFLGHSESVTGMNVPLTHIKPTVYRKI